MWHKPRLIGGKEIAFCMLPLANMIIAIILLSQNAAVLFGFTFNTVWIAGLVLAIRVQRKRQERRKWLHIFFKTTYTSGSLQRRYISPAYSDVHETLRNKHMI